MSDQELKQKLIGDHTQDQEAEQQFNLNYTTIEEEKKGGPFDDQRLLSFD